jgi:hypothetical protein
MYKNATQQILQTFYTWFISGSTSAQCNSNINQYSKYCGNYLGLTSSAIHTPVCGKNFFPLVGSREASGNCVPTYTQLFIKNIFRTCLSRYFNHTFNLAVHYDMTLKWPVSTTNPTSECTGAQESWTIHMLVLRSTPPSASWTQDCLPISCGQSFCVYRMCTVF